MFQSNTQSDLVEKCDHVFIFNQVRLADSHSESLFENKSVLKVWQE